MHALGVVPDPLWILCEVFRLQTRTGGWQLVEGGPARFVVTPDAPEYLGVPYEVARWYGFDPDPRHGGYGERWSVVGVFRVWDTLRGDAKRLASILEEWLVDDEAAEAARSAKQ